jgi:hypothetical protein
LWRGQKSQFGASGCHLCLKCTALYTWLYQCTVTPFTQHLSTYKFKILATNIVNFCRDVRSEVLMAVSISQTVLGYDALSSRR